MDFYMHHVPGRLRVRIPAVRQNPSNAACVESLLNLHGVDKITISHLTGSVVVIYDPDLVEQSLLLQILHDHKFFDISRAVTCDEHVRRITSRAADKMGRAFFTWTVGKALESRGLSLLAAFI